MMKSILLTSMCFISTLVLADEYSLVCDVTHPVMNSHDGWTREVTQKVEKKITPGTDEKIEMQLNVNGEDIFIQGRGSVEINDFFSFASVTMDMQIPSRKIDLIDIDGIQEMLQEKAYGSIASSSTSLKLSEHDEDSYSFGCFINRKI